MSELIAWLFGYEIYLLRVFLILTANTGNILGERIVLRIGLRPELMWILDVLILCRPKLDILRLYFGGKLLIKPK